MNILDLIFPKKCVICKEIGSFLCDNCFSYLSFSNRNLCLVCNKPSADSLTHKGCKSKYGIDGCFSALSGNKTAKKIIYSFKNKPFIYPLKKDLGDLFYESLIQNESFLKQLKNDRWQLVPIGIDKRKLRKRGYNQAEVLAKELSERFKLKLVNKNDDIANSYIFLVDDFVSTGATLKRAANVLKKAGAIKVIGVTLVAILFLFYASCVCDSLVPFRSPSI